MILNGYTQVVDLLKAERAKHLAECDRIDRALRQFIVTGEEPTGPAQLAQSARHFAGRRGPVGKMPALVAFLKSHPGCSFKEIHAALSPHTVKQNTYILISRGIKRGLIKRSGHRGNRARAGYAYSAA